MLTTDDHVESAARQPELVATRRTRVYDTALIALTAALGCASAWAVGALLAVTDWTWTARNVLILTALFTVTRMVTSDRAAAVCCAAVLLVTGTYGVSNPGSRLIRVFQTPPEEGWCLGISLAATALALLAHAAIPRPRRRG